MRVFQINEKSGGKSTTVYHGTTSAFIDSIKKHGLDPDSKTKSWTTGSAGGDSYGGVYLTADPWTARNAAVSAAEKHGGDPIILKIQYRLGSGSMDEDEIVDTILGNTKYAVVHNEFSSLLRDCLSVITGKPTKATTTHLSNVIQYLISKFKRIPVKDLRDNWSIEDKLRADERFRELIQKVMESVRITDMTNSTNVRVTRPIKFSGGTRILDIMTLDQADDLLNEAINMMPVRSKVNSKLITNSIKTAASKIHTWYKEGKLDFVRNMPSAGGLEFKKLAIPIVCAVAATEYVNAIVPHLEQIAMEAVGRKVSVKITKLPAGVRGEAQGKEVRLSELHFKTPIRKYFEKELDKTVSKITPESSADDVFFAIIEAFMDDDFVLDVTCSLGTKDLDVASVFMHELVHVKQSAMQGFRYDAEYRSYLSNQKVKRKARKTDPSNPKGEFEQFDLDDFSSVEKKKRYMKLYLASPQEIAAFAHNLADSVITDEFIEYAQDEKDLPSKESVAKSIAMAVNAKIGKPTTDKEKFVWKRYANAVAKLVLAEIDEAKKRFASSNEIK